MIAQGLHDESALVHDFQAHAEGAMSAVYDRYADALYGVIHRIVGSEEAAEDVLQDAFVKIWRSATQYSPYRGRFFTWMLNIARHAAIDHLRSKAHRDAVQRVDIDTSHKAIDLSASDQIQVEHIGIRSLVDRLEPDQRLLIDLAYYQGYSQTELAEELNLPLGTVKSRMRAAMKVLRSWIE